MLLLGIILLLVVAVFALENRTPVTVAFLAWRYETQLGLAMIASAVAGAIIIYLSGLVVQARLRAQLRGAEARLRELERRQAAAQETPQESPGPSG